MINNNAVIPVVLSHKNMNGCIVVICDYLSCLL